jgi:hypothetical protein
MSLTHEGYQNRMWRGLPELRKILEDKKIMDSNHRIYWGLTSAGDNLFDYINRLLKILILVDENKEEIIENTNENTYEQYIKEIHNLVEASTSVANDFKKNDILNEIIYRIDEKLMNKF